MEKIINYLNNRKFVLFGFIIFFILLPYFLAISIGNTILKKIFFFLIFFIFLLLIFEFFFLLIYRLRSGFHYKFIKKIPFDKMLREPHPYLSFVYKKNFKRTGQEKNFNYPLHPGLKAPENLSTNSLGFVNGELGDRNIDTVKPDGLIRINCIGASTTGNYFTRNNIVYSYPLELERALKKKYNKNIEVNNFGHGGYNSADILISFILQSIDTKPDYLIIYHGYNDIRSYLTPNFNSDYSHSRKNLGEIYWKYYLGSKIPDIKLNFFNYIINKHLFSSNETYSILDAIAKNRINLEQDFRPGLITYERNLQHIIDISKNNNIKIILSTFCLYLYPQIKNEKLHIVYDNIVNKENEIIKKLAKKNNLILVDAASLIPRTDENFVDSIHFSPKGMKLLAEIISKEIII